MGRRRLGGRGCWQGFSRIGEVAKRSNAADCKSVALAASKVRVLPSPPAPAPRSRRSAGTPVTAGRFANREVKRRACPPKLRAKRLLNEGGRNSVVESQPSKL